MKIKNDKDFNGAVKASKLGDERTNVIASQVRSTRADKLDQLFEIWRGKEGGLKKGEMDFAESLVDLDAPSAPPASEPASPPSPGVSAGALG
jgi:hypothetical protein